MSKNGKHHYIPVFYLKKWTGPDGRLCEFSKPYDRVKPKRIHPGGTGFVHGLYSIADLPPELAQVLEKGFMKTTDTLAANALQVLLSGSLRGLTSDTRSGWSRFIVSLVLRNPEMVIRAKHAARALMAEARLTIEQDYAENRLPTDPDTYAKYAALHSPNPEGRAAAILMEKVIDSPKIGQWINNMRWRVFVIPPTGFNFLTSDRPVIMTNGISHQDAQLILPISKKHLFVATNNVQTENQIMNLAKEGTLAQQVNDRIALQAKKLVFASDDTSLKFVARRLGRQLPASPFETGEPTASGF